MKKFNDEFFQRYASDLRSRVNKAKNDLQLRWKPIKIISKNY